MKDVRGSLAALGLVIGVAVLVGSSTADAKRSKALPVEQASVTFAPDVPAPITRKSPAVVEVTITSDDVLGPVNAGAPDGAKFLFWTFGGKVPGPFIRARVGDTLQVTLVNRSPSEMPHNIDFHAVTGPGGGAPALTASPGEQASGSFKLLHPGLYIYHCAAPPVMDHIARGMYGLILVEPKGGMPKVDREYYVLQSEYYTEGNKDEPGELTYSHEKGLMEHPEFVVFNGAVGSLMGERSLKANVGETVRIYFGNAGPNLISSFHVIGEIFDRVYREGSLTTPPGTDIQTTLVPPGGATIVEFGVQVPGDFTLVDHAIFRIEKGAVGFLHVEGAENPEIYNAQGITPCERCLVHP